MLNINTEKALDNYLELDDRIICIALKSFSKFVQDQKLKENIARAKILIDRLNDRKIYKEISKKLMNKTPSTKLNREILEKELTEKTGVKKDDICIIVN